MTSRAIVNIAIIATPSVDDRRFQPKTGHSVLRACCRKLADVIVVIILSGLYAMPLQNRKIPHVRFETSALRHAAGV
jgi:hypothetical protein